METIALHRKFNGKVYRFIGAYNHTEAKEMVKKIRGPKSFARIVEAPERYKATTRHFNNYLVYARLEG